jgi:hypothetical protein
MADGSVRFITRDIAPEVFKALCTMAGGESVPALDNVAPPVPPFTTTASPAKPQEKGQPAEKVQPPNKPVSSSSPQDPWSADSALLAKLAPETRLGQFAFRPPTGYTMHEGKPSTPGEVSCQWVGPAHQDVGVPPILIASVTPLETRLAGEPLDVVLKEMVARFPKDGGQWEFDGTIERGLIQGKLLFARVACRFRGQGGQQLQGYYYQHTDGQVGLGILILDHPTHAAQTLPILQASVATFRKP